MKPVKKSASGRTRSPRGPARRTCASRARRATATSPPGGGVKRLPPTVPMLRIDQLAVWAAASRSSGTVSWARSWESVTAAPMASTSPCRSRRSRPAWRRLMTRSGREIPSLMRGIATVPPAITSRSCPWRSSRPIASGTDRGIRYSRTLIGRRPLPPRRPGGDGQGGPVLRSRATGRSLPGTASPAERAVRRPRPNRRIRRPFPRPHRGGGT